MADANQSVLRIGDDPVPALDVNAFQRLSRKCGAICQVSVTRECWCLRFAFRSEGGTRAANLLAKNDRKDVEEDGRDCPAGQRQNDS